MKAVVTQLLNGSAILLTEDGRFIRVQNRRYRLGQTVDRWTAFQARTLRGWLAASLIFCLLGGCALASRLPAYYVSVDVNPSIEMQVSLFDRVLSMEAVNADAEPVVSRALASGALGKPLPDSLVLVVDSLTAQGYLQTKSSSDLVIGVASYGLKNVTTVMAVLASANFTKTDTTADVHITAFEVTKDAMQRAATYHTTAGKWTLVENALQSVGDGQPIEAWLQQPIAAILAHQQTGQPIVQPSPEGQGQPSGAPPPQSSGKPASNTDGAPPSSPKTSDSVFTLPDTFETPSAPAPTPFPRALFQLPGLPSAPETTALPTATAPGSTDASCATHTPAETPAPTRVIPPADAPSASPMSRSYEPTPEPTRAPAGGSLIETGPTAPEPAPSENSNEGEPRVPAETPACEELPAPAPENTSSDADASLPNESSTGATEAAAPCPTADAVSLFANAFIAESADNSDLFIQPETLYPFSNSSPDDAAIDDSSVNSAASVSCSAQDDATTLTAPDALP